MTACGSDVHGNPDTITYPGATTAAVEAVVGALRLVAEARPAQQLAVQAVGPRVVRAGDRLARVARLGDQLDAAVAVGADLVMPGPDLSPNGLATLIEEERVTVAAGVPTIWMGVLPALKGRDTPALRVIPCGGSAVPKALSEAFREQLGLPIYQAWGMTETSPVASVANITSDLAGLPEAELADLRATQGRPLVGCLLYTSPEPTRPY